MKERSEELLAQIAKIERVDPDDLFAAVAEEIDKVVEDTRENKTYQLISYDTWEGNSTLYTEGGKRAMLKKFKELDAQLSKQDKVYAGYSVISPAGNRIAGSNMKE